MADRTHTVSGIPYKAVDLGDGTFAQKVDANITVEGGDASAANQASQITQETALNTIAGATTDAAVITDANGTLSAKLRGLVVLMLQLLAKFPVPHGQGAANIAGGQVAASTTAATLVAARATRRTALVKNLHTTIAVYIGPATVTAANGMELKAGESVSVDWTGLIQVIAASGTPTVAFLETYD